MSDEDKMIKPCYRHKNADGTPSIEGVEKTKFQRTVKYKGKEVTYEHEGHYCTKCKIPYDSVDNPPQTKRNREKIEAEYNRLVEEDKKREKEESAERKKKIRDERKKMVAEGKKMKTVE